MKLQTKLICALFLASATVPHVAAANVKEDFNKITQMVKALSEQFVKDLKQEHRVSLRNLLAVLNIKEDQVPQPLRVFLDKVEFRTPKLKIDKDTYQITWENALVMGVENKLSVRLYVGPGVKGSPSGASLSIGIPGTQTLNTLLPDIKEGLKKAEESILPENVRKVLKDAKLSVDDFAKVVDWLEFENVGVIAGTQFTDPVWGELLTGINVRATLRFVGPLKTLTDLIGKDLTTIQARGIITLLGGGTEIRGIYPGKLTLLRWPIDPKSDPFFHLRTTGIEMRVGLSVASNWFTPVPTIKAITGYDVKLPFQKDYVSFKGSFDVMPLGKVGPSIEVAGWMDGMIKNMFGVPGLDVGNIGLAATIPFAAAAGAVVPTGVDMKGEVHVGPYKPSSIMSINIDKQQVAVIAKLAAMSTQDFANWIIQLMQGAVDLGKTKLDMNFLRPAIMAGLPPFKLSDLEIYFVPAAAEIFETRYSTGIYAKGYGEIFGMGGGFQFAAYYFGLKLAMYLKEVRIPQDNPFIIISGTDKAKESLAKLSGPTMTAEMSSSKKTQYGSADDIAIKEGPILLGELTPGRQLLYMDGLLKVPALNIESSTHVVVNPTDIEVVTSGKLAGMDSQFYLKGNPLKPESFVVSGTLIQKGMSLLGNGLQEEAKKFSQKANNDLAAAQKNVQQWQQQAEKDIDAWITGQVAIVDKEIGRLMSKIATAKKRCDAIPYNWLDPFGLINGRAKACWEITIEGPWDVLALGTAQLHKEVTLKGVARTVAKGGVRFASANAQLGLGVAQAGVEFARATTDFMGKVIAGGLNISMVTVNGSLKELVDRGTLPKVEVQGTILGKQFKQMYQVNFKEPGQLPAQIVLGIVQVFGPQPKPYKAAA